VRSLLENTARAEETDETVGGALRISYGDITIHCYWSHFWSGSKGNGA